MAETRLLDNPGFRAFPALTEAWKESVPNARLTKLRRAAQDVREELLSDGPVTALATCTLVTFPYPALFAFTGAALSPAPYIMMTNRMQVVQFEREGKVRTLLFNPTDYVRSQNAPFFAKLKKKYGEFLSDRVMSTRHGTVAGHLEKLGLRPEDIDFIAYDHLHVQDIRGWLGGDEPAYFPRAKLLVQRREWLATKNLHPMQTAWYVPDGISGVPDDRVILLDGDAWLGKGAAIIDTPGHTGGNMSLAVVTDSGLFVVSENGVSTESYSPERSRIPGVRSYARQYGYEVVLNGNTREASLDQYSSMVLEKTLAGPSKTDPAYVNFYPSSELTASLLAPGLSPTFSHPPIAQGHVRALHVA